MHGLFKMIKSLSEVNAIWIFLMRWPRNSFSGWCTRIIWVCRGLVGVRGIFPGDTDPLPSFYIRVCFWLLLIYMYWRTGCFYCTCVEKSKTSSFAMNLFCNATEAIYTQSNIFWLNNKTITWTCHTENTEKSGTFIITQS